MGAWNQRREIDYMWLAASQLKSYGRKDQHVARLIQYQGNTGRPVKGSIKESMRIAAEHRVGDDLTDNEADALWLAWYLEAHLEAV